jgi:DNA-binding LacI/PurR family transcriptional regulator
VVVKQAAGGRKVEGLLFELFTREIRNAVVWPYAERLDPEGLRRLRGLGLNLVFFDHVPGSAAADTVSVDNAHAVTSLLARLDQRGARAPCFIGWDRAELTSNAEREAAFVAAQGAGRVVRLPWRSEVGVEQDVAAALARLPAGADGLLCGNGGIGIAAQRLALERGWSLPVVCVDDLPGAEALALDAYAQPMEALARLAWRRLVAQNRAPDAWTARTARLRGELLVRTGAPR